MGLKKNIFGEENNTSIGFGPTVTCTGHMKSENGWFVDVHTHDFTEIWLCVAGTGILTIDKVDYSVNPGDIAIFNMSVENSSRNVNKEYFEFFFLGIRDFFYPPFPYNTLMPDDVPVFSSGPYFTQLAFYFQELINETSEPEIIYMPVVSALANTVAMQVMRISQFNTLVKDSDSQGYSHFIKNYIDKNYNQKINLDLLSKETFASKSSISHQFKKDMGMSPIDYLIKKGWRQPGIC